MTDTPSLKSTADTLARKLIPPREMLKRYLDLNTDYGQTGHNQLFDPPETSLLAYVSSVNIPCGVHDGHPPAIIQAIKTAQRFGCAVGAHVGYPDPATQGREPMDVDKETLQAWLWVQLGAFSAMARSCDVPVEHVRPHGALYGAFVNNPTVALWVAEVLYQFDPWLMLIAPVGPVLQEVHGKTGIRISPEILMGKRYGADGYPVKRRFDDPLPPNGVMSQARQLILEKSLTTIDGQVLPMAYKTLHVSPRLEGAMALVDKLCTVLGQPVSPNEAAVCATGWE